MHFTDQRVCGLVGVFEKRNSVGPPDITPGLDLKTLDQLERHYFERRKNSLTSLPLSSDRNRKGFSLFPSVFTARSVEGFTFASELEQGGNLQDSEHGHFGSRS